MKENFDIHWIAGNKRILLPKNILHQIPAVGDEIRVSRETFLKVVKIVWCLDENRSMGQAVNIQLEKVNIMDPTPKKRVMRK